MSENTKKGAAGQVAPQAPTIESLQAQVNEQQATINELQAMLAEANATIAAQSRVRSGNKPVVTLPAKGDRPAMLVVVNHGITLPGGEKKSVAEVAADIELVEKLLESGGSTVSKA